MNKKVISVFLCMMTLLFLLSGCACKHEMSEATCTAPATCLKCGETEGEALGHSYADADCVNPKTCTVCGETEGEALGHSYADADCVTPKTCTVCGETEGEALGHSYADADCVNPKTCTVCSETEGEALGHSYADADCVNPKTCTVCGETEGEALGHSFGEWAEGETGMERLCHVCGVMETEAIPTLSGVKVGRAESSGISLYVPAEVTVATNVEMGLPEQPIDGLYYTFSFQGEIYGMSLQHTLTPASTTPEKQLAAMQREKTYANCLLMENKNGVPVILADTADELTLHCVVVAPDGNIHVINLWNYEKDAPAVDDPLLENLRKDIANSIILP